MTKNAMTTTWPSSARRTPSASRGESETMPVTAVSVSSSEQTQLAQHAQQAQRWQDAEELRWAARHWATQLGVKTPRIHIRQMTSKWASISTAGRLTLNTDLLPLPRRLGEFVIVHELVHLLAPNHSKVFKSFMHAYLPDWQQRERDLRQHSIRHGTNDKYATMAKAEGIRQHDRSASRR
jgi:predicted metal-dependent hydrolase